MEYMRLKDVRLAEYVNQRIYLVFAASNVQVRTQKDGTTMFIQLQMIDGDTCVEARLFGATPSCIELVKEGRVYEAAIDVRPYKNSISCVIYNIQTSNLPLDEFRDWAPNMEWAGKIINNTLNDIANTIYGRIAGELVCTNWHRFCHSPAASSHHHSQLGGLFCHTAEVIETSRILAELYSDLYPTVEINRQLLYSAALLHDIGKLEEYSFNMLGKAEYTIEGALQHHIYIGTSMIECKAYELMIGRQTYRINEANEREPIKSEEQLSIEKTELMLLKHCILSHHGKKEWGSPVTPSILEAYILHQADNTSAKTNEIITRMKNIEPGGMERKWDGGDYSTIYKPDI